MKDITLRTIEQLGAAVRLKRQEQGLSQAALADLLGVERKWVLRLEAGNARAEVGLVLKALNALGVEAALHDSSEAGPSRTRPASQLDEVFERLRQPRRK